MRRRLGDVRVNRAALLAAALILVGTIAHGQTSSEPARRGGLVPSRTAGPETQFRTRDELARQWDLNADGTIDEAEAEVARMKMRRQRTELLRKLQSSPLVKPAEETAAEEDPAEDTLAFPDQPAPQPKAASAKTDTTPPNNRPDEASGKAPPPKRDLNAGRLPAGFPPARGIPAGTVPPGRTGMMPSSQPPQSTTTGMRRFGPVTPPAAGATRQPPAVRPAPAARPTPTVPARPRVTAEEIGGP